MGAKRPRLMFPATEDVPSFEIATYCALCGAHLAVDDLWVCLWHPYGAVTALHDWIIGVRPDRYEHAALVRELSRAPR